MAYIQTSALIAAPLAQVFDHVSDLKHLPEWVGPNVQVSFAQVPEPMVAGREYSFEMSRFGVSSQVLLRIEKYQAGQMFVDRQVHGFFQHWLHTQQVDVHDKNTTLLTDIVEYTMPYGLLGQLADDLYARQELTRLLNGRYDRINQHFVNVAQPES